MWDVNVDIIDISKLFKSKTNSKYLIGYLDKAIRPLPKRSEHVKTFKVKVEMKIKTIKFMYFHIDDE